MGGRSATLQQGAELADAEGFDTGLGSSMTVDVLKAPIRNPGPIGVRARTPSLVTRGDQ